MLVALGDRRRIADQAHPATAASAVELELILEPVAEGPIAGTVRDPHGRSRAFCGWLELMDALEALRPGAPPD